MSAQHTQNNTSLTLTTVSTFCLVTLFLFMIDFVPEPRVVAQEIADVPSTHTTINDEEAQSTSSPLTTKEKAVVEVEQAVRSGVPVRIVVDDIEVDTPVSTPESNTIDVLDRALLHGAVHYPESALAGEEGNMLLFGHSSYLPVVHNKAFQAFNELNKLEPGAIVEVHSTTHVYEYRIVEVHLARADETIIRFDASVPQLTLATCNNFGAKQERWVATGTLVRATSVSS